MNGSVDEFLDGFIRDVLLARRYPVCIRLGREQIRELVNESCSHRITVRGQDRPIFEAYCRAHPEAVPWYDCMTGSGVRSLPAVTRRALVHMRAYKRAFGISHYDGIPIEETPTPRIEVVSRPWPTEQGNGCA